MLCWIPVSCAELYSCCSGLRNAWEDKWLWDSVPKLACAAEQAPTRSHPSHSGEIYWLAFAAPVCKTVPTSPDMSLNWSWPWASCLGRSWALEGGRGGEELGRGEAGRGRASSTEGRGGNGQGGSWREGRGGWREHLGGWGENWGGWGTLMEVHVRLVNLGGK